MTQIKIKLGKTINNNQRALLVKIIVNENFLSKKEALRDRLTQWVEATVEKRVKERWGITPQKLKLLKNNYHLVKTGHVFISDPMNPADHTTFIDLNCSAVTLACEFGKYHQKVIIPWDDASHSIALELEDLNLKESKAWNTLNSLLGKYKSTKKLIADHPAIGSYIDFDTEGAGMLVPVDNIELVNKLLEARSE